MRKKALSAVTAILIVVMTLGIVSAEHLPPADITPFLTVAFNETGDELEFRVGKDGIPGQTALAFISSDESGDVQDNMKFIGDITLKTEVGSNGGYTYVVTDTVAGAVTYSVNGNTGTIAGGIAVSKAVPENTLIFSIDVIGAGRITVNGVTALSTDDGDIVSPLLMSVSNLPPCGGCDICESGEPPVPGYVLGGEEVTIFDGLETLKYLVEVDNAIENCENSRTASLITENAMDEGEPSVFDTLEILKHLVDMDSKVQSR